MGYILQTHFLGFKIYNNFLISLIVGKQKQHEDILDCMEIKFCHSISVM